MTTSKDLDLSEVLSSTINAFKAGNISEGNEKLTDLLGLLDSTTGGLPEEKILALKPLLHESFNRLKNRDYLGLADILEKDVTPLLDLPLSAPSNELVPHRNTSKTAFKPLINTDKGFNAMIKGKEGYIVYNKNDTYIGKAIEKYGEFSGLEVEIFENLCHPSDVVIEVGANIGTHTLVFSRLVGPTGRVYAYEPQRIVFQTLCANLALNSITNVECMQQALSNEVGHLVIPEINYHREGNFGGIEIDKFTSGSKVEVVKLDSRIDLPRLNFLKIDAEGMEHQIISGAVDIINKYKPILYVENDRLEKSKALIELINTLDYRIFWHLPPLYNEHNYAGDSENLWPGIVSVNMLCIHRSVKTNIDLLENSEPDFHPFK